MCTCVCVSIMMGPERKLKNKLGSPNDRQHHHLARQQIGHAECACRAGPIPALHGINGMIEGKIVTRNHGLNICMYECMYVCMSVCLYIAVPLYEYIAV
jgi:hypothetical protein